ncbi:hypothetical protein BCU68_10110 [Vibrio sp. 10N.286.49.B3]|uniref:lysoplasmalogenase family protein n=1 Tax=Vibrio sp. 10N.286.49.B3 TaxID=1880855 RepID=UPI000C821DA9|nr:lysoplasmalogenase family protein [Vibrio sp. 10N.286.49.B3]PMH45439.1 hypothetical protein BCU68_10110 [Vibrio sp. 10N.286.49.B3]
MWSWLAVGLSSFVSITAANENKPKRGALFAFLTLFLLLWIIITYHGERELTHYWVMVALFFSTSSHMLKKMALKKYWYGYFIGSLLAQICYSKAFWMQLPIGIVAWWIPALLFAAAVMVFLLLLPQLERLFFPSFIMGMMLTQLSWSATRLWLNMPTFLHALGILGCLLLIISVITGAIHNYRRPIKHPFYIIQGSFFASQALLVASVL